MLVLLVVGTLVCVGGWLCTGCWPRVCGCGLICCFTNCV